MKTYEKYLNERRPTKADYNIKDMAQALTGEIETAIENIVEDWIDNNEVGEMPTGDIVKMVNLAMKNINRNKVVRNVSP